MTSITQLQQQYQQPQHQLNGQQYLFIQPQQQLQHPPSVTVGSVLPRPQVSAAQGNMTGTNNPTILLPAGSTNGQNVPTNTNSGSSHHAVLAASLVGGFPHQFQFPHGLLPQQYLDIAAAAAVASGAGMAVAAPNQGPSPFQHLPPPPPQAQQHQQQSAAPLMAPPGVPCTVSGNNKRGLQETAVSTVGPNKKLRETAPSIVSSSTNGTALKGPIAPPPPSSADLEPPKELSEEDLAKLTPAERRRYERNLREQQRSYRISQQIKELRDVLSESNVPFKPNKYSILLSVVEYIKQLQSRAIMLDSEHQKLITTIRQTNETVNLGNAPTSTDESETINAASTSESGSESELVFVKGIDYRSVFEQCPAALGIAALDGRILECNTEFQTLLGYSRREELLKQSLFNLVRNHQDIFRAMAQMLKTAEDPQPPEPLAAATSSPAPNNDYIIADANPGNPSKENAISNDRFWTGPVTSKLDSKVSTGFHDSTFISYPA
jgi:PAS domain-containing protein